jgi:predicted nucleotidyltransferase
MAVDITEVRAFLLRKEQEEMEHCRALFEKASADCAKMIAHIIANYPDVTIYQWGSLLKAEEFNALSDIDIALEGVGSAEIFFRLSGELMKMTDFPLDLVELEKINPIHRKSIKENGRLVYGNG